MTSISDFLHQHTAPSSPPLVPELQLYLGGTMLDLWFILEETMGPGQEPPYWAYAWPGGQALARWILDHPESVKTKIVLDFGSGGGISALAAVLAGAREVHALDLAPLAAEAALANAQLNQLQVKTWTGNALKHDWPDAEVVLAGDVFYEQPMAGFAEVWLRRFSRRGCEVLFGDPGRRYLPATGTQKLADYLVPTSTDLEDSHQRRTAIYRLQEE